MTDVKIDDIVKIHDVHDIMKMTEFEDDEDGRITGAFKNVDCMLGHIEIVGGGEYRVSDVDSDGDIRLHGAYGTYPNEIIKEVING